MTNFFLLSVKFKKAFTLVELSIVLVIVGLLTAGIVGGQSLIESAKINKTISQYNSFKTAHKAFLLEYDSIPGDFSKATDYFGVATGGCPYGDRTNKDTCNGDGDGLIENQEEGFVYWEHLDSSGILPNNLLGKRVNAMPTSGCFPDMNVPKSSLNNAGFLPFYTFFSGFFKQYPTRNILLLGKTPTDNTWCHAPALTTKQAKAIDSKIDDGKPGFGIISSLGKTSVYDFNPNCRDNDDSAIANYKLSYTSEACSLVLDLD